MQSENEKNMVTTWEDKLDALGTSAEIETYKAHLKAFPSGAKQTQAYHYLSGYIAGKSTR